MNMKTKLKDSMKASLGSGLSARPVDSIFTPTIEPQAQENKELKVPNFIPSEVEKKTKSKPEQPSMEMDKVTVPMAYELRQSIDKIARAINKNKVKKKERITTNSVIRALLTLVEVIDFDISGIDSEIAIKEAMEKAVRRKESV